jgi:hypothetical protein
MPASAQPQPESYVFLSHNTKDFPIIKAISDKLQARGVTTWIDTEHILAGERFEEKIVAAMNQAKANVVFCGPHGLGRWQAAEVPFASKLDTEKKIRAIVVLLPNVDEAKVSQDIGLLSTKSYIIFKTEEDEAALENLLRSLQAVINAGTASEAPSSPVEDGGRQTDSSHPSTPDFPKAMADSQALFNYLKSLLPGQFSEVVFRLDIDEANLSRNVGQVQNAKEVIQLLKQSPDGLTRLEAVLKDILKLRDLYVSSPTLSSTPSRSNYSHLNELTSPQRRELRDALISAFPNRNRLELMLEDELGTSLNRITEGQPDYELAVRDLIKWAEANGKVPELLEGALKANPGNPKLKNFAGL